MIVGILDRIVFDFFLSWVFSRSSFVERQDYRCSGYWRLNSINVQPFSTFNLYRRSTSIDVQPISTFNLYWRSTSIDVQPLLTYKLYRRSTSIDVPAIDFCGYRRSGYQPSGQRHSGYQRSGYRRSCYRCFVLVPFPNPGFMWFVIFEFYFQFWQVFNLS